MLTATILHKDDEQGEQNSSESHYMHAETTYGIEFELKCSGYGENRLKSLQRLAIGLRYITAAIDLALEETRKQIDAELNSH